jgi:hypothetical protein
MASHIEQLTNEINELKERSLAMVCALLPSVLLAPSLMLRIFRQLYFKENPSSDLLKMARTSSDRKKRALRSSGPSQSSQRFDTTKHSY